MISLLPMYLTHIFIKDYYTPYMIKISPFYILFIYILIAGAMAILVQDYIKENINDSKILKIIVYLNIVAWVIPILGVLLPQRPSFGEKISQKITSDYYINRTYF